MVIKNDPAAMTTRIAELTAEVAELTKALKAFMEVPGITAQIRIAHQLGELAIARKALREGE